MPDRNVPPPEPGRLRAIVEALVFAAEEPLTLGDLTDLFPGAPAEALQETLDAVARSWEEPDRGLQIIKVAGGCRMTTRPELGEWVRALFRARNRRRLSPAALETLAIVAYRQPVTKAAVERIRGVDSDYTIRSLLHRRLVVELGRSDAPGRPFLYGTGFEFLERFGLTTLDELPPLDVDVAVRLAEEGGSAASGGEPENAEPAAQSDALAGGD
jgi:segregation and condensation protein B